MGAGSFQSTRWTVVLAAAGDHATPSQSHEALSELCRIYWRPVYLILRRDGHAPADAQDLTQGFFADFITTRFYARADREKGRFRSFLLGVLKHFVSDCGRVRWRKSAAAGQSASHSMRRQSWKRKIRSRASVSGILNRSMTVPGRRRFSDRAGAARGRMRAGRQVDFFEALKSHLSPGGADALSYSGSRGDAAQGRGAFAQSVWTDFAGRSPRNGDRSGRGG